MNIAHIILQILDSQEYGRSCETVYSSEFSFKLHDLVLGRWLKEEVQQLLHDCEAPI